MPGATSLIWNAPSVAGVGIWKPSATVTNFGGALSPAIATLPTSEPGEARVILTSLSPVLAEVPCWPQSPNPADRRAAQIL